MTKKSPRKGQWKLYIAKHFVYLHSQCKASVSSIYLVDKDFYYLFKTEGESDTENNFLREAYVRPLLLI